MKRFLLTALSLMLTFTIYAQNANDSIWKAHIENKEYQVWLDIDFYNNNILIPGWEQIFGPLPGYFGAKRDTRTWAITEAEINNNTAKISITNDYGSEDLTAELKFNPTDSTYTLERIDGSIMKIVVDRKWVKIPKVLILNRPPKKE